MSQDVETGAAQNGSKHRGYLHSVQLVTDQYRAAQIEAGAAMLRTSEELQSIQVI